MKIDIFFDYTCRHSFALDRLLSSGLPNDLEIKWRTCSLKELRNPADDASVLLDPEASFSVLALALSHAVDAENFDGYHHSVFERLQDDQRRSSNEDLFELAEAAGVTRKAFSDQRASLVERLVEDQQQATGRWKAHGTPTIVFDETTAVYFRFLLEDLPKAGGWELIQGFATNQWLLEAKRST